MLYDIRDGKADAGSVRTNILERMAKEGKINLADFKFISHQDCKHQTNYLHSTNHYPEWPLAKLSHTDNRLAELVTTSLINMSPTTKAVQQGSYYGWTIPLNYQTVRDCLKSLKEPPYEDYGKLSLLEAFHQHKLTVYVFAVFFLLLILQSLKLLSSNRRLKKAIANHDDELAKCRKTEDLLQNRQAKLASIYRASPTGIGVIENRVFREVNQYFCEMMGYSEKELLGKNSRLIYPFDKDYEFVGHQQINNYGGGSFKTRMRRKDGQVIDVILSSTPLNIEDLSAGITFTVHDITKIKSIKRKLEQSENKFRAMMESMLDPVYICSLDYRVEYMNPAMIKRTGRDATGELCYQALHDFDKPCLWCTGKNTLHGTYLETDIISPKDNHSYHISHSPVVNEDGSISNMIIFRDTTELKKLEEQLFQTQKMESIGNLAGGIAHDFNNILTVINMHSELVMMKLEEGSELWLDIEEIHKAGERAADLTRQLLAFSRKQRIIPKSVNINKVIANLGKMLNRLISEDISLETRLDEAVGRIYADPGQLEQIVINLVVNARDAVKNPPEKVKKTIQISTSQIFLDDDYVAFHQGSTTGHYLQLQVEDNGCGMSEDVKKHIFEPFYTTKAMGEGTGMGLAMVYGIVKQNNGSIYVYSELGQGTTFKLYWPLTMKEDTKIMEKVKPEDIKGGSETILLAEDNQQLRTIASRQLRQAGYTVVEAKDGKNALEKAKSYQGTIELLFTDAVMPIMGGLELSEKIKEIYPDIQVLFASGYMDNGIHQEILTGAKGRFINKPYNIQDIMVMIRQLLDEPVSG